jgi:hypothetical protein
MGTTFPSERTGAVLLSRESLPGFVGRLDGLTVPASGASAEKSILPGPRQLANASSGADLFCAQDLSGSDKRFSHGRN